MSGVSCSAINSLPQNVLECAEFPAEASARWGWAVVLFFVSQQQGEQVSFHSMHKSKHLVNIESVRDRKVLPFDQCARTAGDHRLISGVPDLWACFSCSNEKLVIFTYIFPQEIQGLLGALLILLE